MKRAHWHQLLLKAILYIGASIMLYIALVAVLSNNCGLGECFSARFSNQRTLTAEWDQTRPCIFVITPTYPRSEQKAEFTRLSQSFVHVPTLFWIVVDDAEVPTQAVTNILTRMNFRFAHLTIQTPKETKDSGRVTRWKAPRGTFQRNLALDWIRSNYSTVIEPGQQAVIYFADDDNTYDVRLFEEMRYVRAVGVWPVGIVGTLLYEAPIVHNSRVATFRSFITRRRKFPVDMAGFAVNLEFWLQRPNARFRLAKHGLQETIFLEGLNITKDQLEPLAESCTKVLVWHTRTARPLISNERVLKARGMPSTLEV